ncbi:hypothetical protein ACFPFV_12490 [Salinicoccus siamensis]|uniref:hypothetical protein n=1 Tax=Salinicoccus siamensis TaxID=381830 RepID=UPI00361CC6D8
MGESRIHHAKTILKRRSCSRTIDGLPKVPGISWSSRTAQGCILLQRRPDDHRVITKS